MDTGKAGFAVSWADTKPFMTSLRQRAEEDLGFRIEYEVSEHAAVTHRAATMPDSFDIFEMSAEYIQVLWNSGAIQPIEIDRIQTWSSINDLVKTGRISPEASFGAGDSPHKSLYVNPESQGNGLGSTPTEQISFLPYVHNVDAFGYSTENPGDGNESWSWLLGRSNHGKVGILIDPAVGFNELAVAAQASGQVSFDDLGNMTRNEIDQFIGVLIELKKSGHFAGFWNTLQESIRFFSSERTQIQTMFAPAFYSLKADGHQVAYASPKEGYRAWQGAVCLSSAAQGSAKDMAYEYMNWWLSGWAGAYLSRQGYYASNPDIVRPYMTTEEWGYWYGGNRQGQILLE
ncbi:MAG: ABC transporter substrate-binding protein [Porticoccaceae bacterium]